MKTMFHLALLCLIFTSCREDINILPVGQYQTQNRSSNTVKATLLLQNGNTLQRNVIKTKGVALSDSLLSVKLFYTSVDSSTFICKNMLITEYNDQLQLMTMLPNGLYTDKNECVVTPYSASAIKMSIQPGNIVTFPNGFIGEEQDGF
jgi:hypothetical protein